MQKPHSYDAKVACFYIENGIVTMQKRHVFYRDSRQHCDLDLSPVSLKGEKRFVFLYMWLSKYYSKLAPPL